MDALIDVALLNGAIAPKVCGAGGGGCIAFYCEEGRKTDVEQALSEAGGAEVLKFSIQQDGLTIKTTK
jgi:D-glycero-alpha-D-manno-heptose-7-phosphate kinase